jgi:predicted MarR family transcription regulator
MANARLDDAQYRHRRLARDKRQTNTRNDIADLRYILRMPVNLELARKVPEGSGKNPACEITRRVREAVDGYASLHRPMRNGQVGRIEEVHRQLHDEARPGSSPAGAYDEADRIAGSRGPIAPAHPDDDSK